MKRGLIITAALILALAATHISKADSLETVIFGEERIETEVFVCNTAEGALFAAHQEEAWLQGKVTEQQYHRGLLPLIHKQECNVMGMVRYIPEITLYQWSGIRVGHNDKGKRFYERTIYSIIKGKIEQRTIYVFTPGPAPSPFRK